MAGPDLSLAGRTALVTGAGRGIGLGMARALASAGCAVAIQDIELDVARAQARQLRDEGARAIALGGDVADVELPAQLVEQTVSQLGGLHILINNAAIQQPRHWMDETPATIEIQWRANLITPMLLCQHAVRIFRPQRWGRIINLGSIQQQRGNPDMLPYSMSKLALENLTQALARDLAADQITVNLIAPGYFNTWRNREEFRTPEDFVERAHFVPMGRIGEPGDTAGITLLLCSEAGGYITGQSIFVDGGMSVR
jgi:glucose 1-dehydrogenase